MPERRHMILCTVTDVRDSQVVYPCCAQCCCKLRSDCFQDRWQCLKCGYTSTNETLEWRYRLSLMVSDGVDLANICVFGSILQQYFGMPPNQFVRFLRKIESLYRNSEDVLMLGLKHCFIGKHYYFGMKASSSGSKNARTGLANVIKQKLTACQNTLFPQEDCSSTVAFQMISAVDKEHTTVYCFIKNLFTDSEEEYCTVNRETDTNIYLSQMLTTDQSNMAADNFERSRPDVENSCVTLGQTTALLSCEMSDFDKTNSASTAKSKQSFINSYKKGFYKNENIFHVQNTTLSKNLSLTDKPAYNSTFTVKGDNSIAISNRKSAKFQCINKSNVVLEKRLTRCLFSCKDNLDSILSDKKRSTKENYGETNSEPLFSEDEETNFTPDTKKQSLLKDGTRKFNLSLVPPFEQPKDLGTKPCKLERDSLQSNMGIFNTDVCNHNLYSDSEPLFSQDNKLLNDVSFETDIKQPISPANCKDVTSNLLHISNRTDILNSLDGSQLLRNLNIPDLPENVPGSEELDLYLYDDSDFESDFEEETSDSDKPHEIHLNDNKLIEIDDKSAVCNETCKKQLKIKESLTQSCIGKNLSQIDFKTEAIYCQEMKTGTIVEEKHRISLNSPSSFRQAVHFDNDDTNFDDIFEDSFDDCDTINKQLYINKIKFFSAKCQDGPKIREEPKLHYELDTHMCNEELLVTFPKMLPNLDQANICVDDVIKKDYDRLQQPVTDTINLVEMDILSCAPDLRKFNETTELCLEFEENLVTGLKPKTCSTNDEGQCMEDSADSFIECHDHCMEIKTSFPNTSERNNFDKNWVENLLENCSELILDTQTTDSRRQETGIKNDSNYLEVQKNISEVLHLNTSEDLFCDSPVIHHVQRTHRKYPNEFQDGNKANSVVKTSMKCVKFSRCLSIHRSVQFIDLQMKINPSYNTESTKLTKSCLKRGLDTIIESNKTFLPEACNSKVLSEIQNSPILNRINEPFSQDLFSPSPLICIKGTQLPHRSHLDKDELSTQNKNLISENSSRHSSTPIETELVTVHNDYNRKSLLSIFSESLGDGLNEEENLPYVKSVERLTNNIDRSSRSPSLFSQSCSLFSFSSSKLSERGDNISKSNLRGGNSTMSHSVNYSCDLFSPSGYESTRTHSPLGDMPVKRLFSDKFS